MLMSLLFLCSRAVPDLTATPIKVPAEVGEYIYQMLEKHVDNGLAFVRKKGKEAVPSVDLNLVCSLTMLLQCMLSKKRWDAPHGPTGSTPRNAMMERRKFSGAFNLAPASTSSDHQLVILCLFSSSQGP